jgi:hypothetical protein
MFSNECTEEINGQAGALDRGRRGGALRFFFPAPSPSLSHPLSCRARARSAAEFQQRVQSGEIQPELHMPSGEGDFGGGGGGGEAPADPRSPLPIYAAVGVFLIAAVAGLAYIARARNAAFEAWLEEDPSGSRRRKYEAKLKKKSGYTAAE